ncbi:MAG: DNA-directed DNA polymerase I [Desulfurococcaceae archaeon]
MNIDKINDVNSIYPLKAFEFKSNGRPVYLLGVHYDGVIGKAVLEVLSEDGSQLFLVPDPTDHKPYFLTNVPIDEVSKSSSIVKHDSFHHIEEVRKYDPLTGSNVVLTKVVTKDPLAVRSLRNKVKKAWEAKIKYHNNYIYDRQLIPTMKYLINESGLQLHIPQVDAKLVELVKKVFSGGRDDYVKLALEWLPLFEEKPPNAKKIAIDVEVYTPFRGRVPYSSTAEYPVISIALVESDGRGRVLVLAREHSWGRITQDYPYGAVVEFFDDETSMILEAFRTISNYPIVVTFNGDNFDFNYLYHRALRLGIDRDYIVIIEAEDRFKVKTGIHIDLYKFFKNKAIQNYAFGGKYQEYTLDSIASALLGIAKIPIDVNVSDLSYGELIAYNYRDSYLTLRLITFDQELVWKLMVLMARISRMSLEDVSRKTISKWIQNLMYWEHRKRNYLIPEPEDVRAVKGSSSVSEAVIQGKKYAGALVIEPPIGIFFDVVVLDIASLYPSIIMKYNLSYETISVKNCSKAIDVEDETGLKLYSICMDQRGLSSEIVGLLRDYRVGIYKRRAKERDASESNRAWYEVVQRAIKVFINASYGVFGSVSFPLYAPAVAESVTALGRKNLYTILQKAADLGIKVLYGDTDSIFLWAPSSIQVQLLQEWVSKNLGLEIELDKIFYYILFTGLKKNYVGVLMDGGLEIKGLVGKKRNVPTFLKDLMAEAFEKLQTVKSSEDFVSLKEWLYNQIKTVYAALRNKELMLDKLAFKVTLSKPLSEYKKNRPPHVKAALQLQSHGVIVEPGDIVSYVKVKSRDGVKAIQLAKIHEVDHEKYVEHIKSTLEQLIIPFGLKWSDVIGMAKLESFLKQ